MEHRKQIAFAAAGKKTEKVIDIPNRNVIYRSMWSVTPTTQWEKDQKHYEKKHARELAAVLNNLTRYVALLNSSKNAACAQAGYLHHESAGVVAIDQKAGGQGLQETRMYVYANQAEKCST